MNIGAGLLVLASPFLLPIAWVIGGIAGLLIGRVMTGWKTARHAPDPAHVPEGG